MVVVVAGEGGDGGLCRGEVGELLAVEHLALERRPEGLDLAVGPGRVDLGPDVPDAELLERPLEAAEHRPGDRDERGAVVGHQVVGYPAQLDRLFEQAEDPDRLLGGHGADPPQEAAVVVDEGDEVTGPRPAGRADEEERGP